MSRWEKNLEKMRRNSRDWRIDDLEVVASKLGMTVHKGREVMLCLDTPIQE